MTDTSTMREAALKVLTVLNGAGFEAHLVGGGVRDTLLGMQPKDFDCTTNATPSEVAELFPGDSSFVGAHFGVSLVKVDGSTIEVATWRRDGDYSDNRRPDNVEFTNNVKEDVLRRDFTVNALLMDVNGNVVDHVNGLEDLHNRALRCVGDPEARFNEDALRMLRAVRFCAQLGFTLDSETRTAIRSNANLVLNVSAERVAAELTRMLTSGRADLAFEMLLDTKLANFVMPELVDMVGCEHNSSKFHPEGDVANHTKLLLAGLEKGCSLTLALGALLHDVGKPRTRGISERGRTHFRGHETVGAEMANDILRRLKFPNDVVDVVVSHVQNHMKFFAVRQMKKSTVMRFARTPNFVELVELNRLDVAASNKDFSDNDFVVRFLCENSTELNRPRFVTGDDLVTMGLTPGPIFKELLFAVETEQLEGRITNREDALMFLRGRL